jgi:hypothetical protein
MLYGGCCVHQGCSNSAAYPLLAPQLVQAQALLLLVWLLLGRALVLVQPAVLLLVLVLAPQPQALQHTKPYGSLLLVALCDAAWVLNDLVKPSQTSLV